MPTSPTVSRSPERQRGFRRNLRVLAVLAVGSSLALTACDEEQDFDSVARPMSIRQTEQPLPWEATARPTSQKTEAPTKTPSPTETSPSASPTTTSPTPTPTTTSPEPSPETTTTPAPTPTSDAPTTEAPPPQTSEPSSPPSGIAAMEERVVELTNAERQAHGCEPLRVDDRLRAAARAHSADMAERNYLSHTSPEGEGPGDRTRAEGYPNWSGENIAMGYRTAEDVVEGWMNSDGHRNNILNCDSRAIGVGAAESSRGPYWTQKFGYE